MSLRRRQYTTAMDGNTAMLIWLGKNWLGQTDQQQGEEKQLPAIQIVTNAPNQPAK